MILSQVGAYCEEKIASLNPLLKYSISGDFN